MKNDLFEITSYLDTLLDSHTYDDVSENGLQVDSGKTEIKRVALAVDSGLSVIEKVIQEKCDLMIVHHGLFWGGKSSVRGALGKKIRALIEGGCSLYATHLPLDGHAKLGNAAQLATFLKGVTVEPFFHYRGRYIGATTLFTPPRTLDQIAKDLKHLPGAKEPLILPFGRDVIGTAGIATGSGTSAIPEAACAKLDLMITGEPKQEAYHLAKELGISVIFAGHYATETLGVQALGRVLSDEFEIDTVFIDEPTGI